MPFFHQSSINIDFLFTIIHLLFQIDMLCGLKLCLKISFQYNLLMKSRKFYGEFRQFKITLKQKTNITTFFLNIAVGIWNQNEDSLFMKDCCNHLSLMTPFIISKSTAETPEVFPRLCAICIRRLASGPWRDVWGWDYVVMWDRQRAQAVTCHSVSPSGSISPVWQSLTVRCWNCNKYCCINPTVSYMMLLATTINILFITCPVIMLYNIILLTYDVSFLALFYYLCNAFFILLNPKMHCSEKKKKKSKF